jgi:multidrug efflux pump subunit AcrB
MWIVALALRRPYTFVVLALVILLAGGVAIIRMPTDIFPEINIPIVAIVWQYGGLSAGEMADIFTTRSERGLSTTVNDIEHIESQSLAGVAVIKVFFHPDAKIEAAVSQISANAETLLGYLPEGARAPNLIRYNAATVPILQLGLSSATLPEQEQYDLGNNFIRTQLATIRGAGVAPPFGGKNRTIMVDLNPKALYARGLSATDISAAVNSQNVMLPAGSAKMGTREYRVEMNNSPEVVEQFNNIPIRSVNGSTVYLRDVAQVRDGFTVQTNVVRRDGKRGALMTIVKTGNASTIDVVARVKEALPRVLSTLPPGLDVATLFDQSIFVKAAVSGVVKEAVAAAALTGLMILLFLGSWRSTLVVCISIPLSIFTSLAILWALGETINIMTLGGMALAVGILVDDATVEIENIHRNLGMGKPVVRAILDGAQQIAVPAFVSTLCICIVFVPVSFLTGTAKFLFTPLALAVVLAMMASYLLSRTVVPTMVNYLIPAEVRLYRGADGEADVDDAGIIWHIHHKFQKGFDRLRDAYAGVLESALHHRSLVLLCFLAVVAACGFIYPYLGTDFFPSVDAGQIRLHVRAASGARIEETEQKVAAVESVIREVIPPSELQDLLDNIGISATGLNLAYTDVSMLGPSDAEILISLRSEHKRPTPDYIRDLRRRLNHDFPESTVFFQQADIVGQTLNFGLPAPIDVMIGGPNRNQEKNFALAQQISKRIARVAGATDVHIQQVQDVPLMRVNIDRARANQMGFSQKDVAQSMLISLSSSAQVGANYWLSPGSRVDYNVAVQTPTYNIDSPQDILNTPVHPAAGSTNVQTVGNVATIQRGFTPGVVNHYNVQPTVDVYANLQDRDLGGVAVDVDKILDEFRPKLPAGSTMDLRGQVSTMRSSFTGMAYGLIVAILLVYFVMAVNFQSWTDPFIILMAIPGALSGILLFLFFTHTTLSVPALMGAIMSIGVGTANSILLVTFANDLRREKGADALTAAWEAGRTRLRPVVMTALAMLAGMVPMALGLGEGGEQNAPLGRAVIGGLVLATIATLFVVPVVYSLLRRTPPKSFDHLETEGWGEDGV